MSVVFQLRYIAFGAICCQYVDCGGRETILPSKSCG